MAKHIIKISIILVWLGLMGWWWLESRTWPVPEKIDAAFLPDYNDYYGLSFGGQKIGWANKSLRRLSNGGYQGLQSLTIKLALEDPGQPAAAQGSMADQALDINFSVTADFDRVMNLLGFRYMIQAGPVAVIESGQVSRPAEDCPGDQATCRADSAAGAEGRLKLEVSLGEFGQAFQDLVEQNRELLGDYADRLDFSRPVELALPAGPGLMQFIPSYLSYLGLKPGANYSLTMLDPVNRSLTPVAMRVEDEAREYDPEIGRDIEVYRVRLSSAGGAGLMWLDRYGRTIREETLGFKLDRVVNLSSKFAEQGMAAQGAVPLKPPPVLQRLFSGREAGGLMDRIQQSVQPRQPEAPVQPDNPSPEAKGEAHD